MHVSKSLLKPEVQKRPVRIWFVIAGVFGCSLGAAATALMALQFAATNQCESVDARNTLGVAAAQAPQIVPVPINISVEAPAPTVVPQRASEPSRDENATGQLKHVVPLKKPLLIISSSVSPQPEANGPITIHHSDDLEHVLSVPVELSQHPLWVQKLIGNKVALFSQTGRCEATIKSLVAAHWLYEDSGPKTKKEAKETFSGSSAFLAATLELTNSCGRDFVGGVILDDGVSGHGIKRFDVGHLGESNKLRRAAVSRAQKSSRSKELQAEFAADGGKGEWFAESWAQVTAVGGANPTRVIVSFSSEGCGAFEGVNVVEYEVSDGVLGKERILSSEFNISSIALAVDANADGHPDILTADDWSSSSSVLVSDGTGAYDREEGGSTDHHICRC